MRTICSARVALMAMALLLALIGCSGDPQTTVTSVPVLSFPPAANASADTPINVAPSASANVPPNASMSPPPGVTVSAPLTEATAAQRTDSPSTDVPAAPTFSTASTTIWLGPGVPGDLLEVIRTVTGSQPGRYALTDDASQADVQIDTVVNNGTPIATWVYTLVAPFPTLTDGVAWDEVLAVWSGNPTGAFAGRPLLMSERTLVALKHLLGEPAAGAATAVPEGELLARAWAEQPAWAIVPFEALEPRWKVLRVDGASPLDRGLDLNTYPLTGYLAAAGAGELVESLLAAVDLPKSNRDETHMTVVVMTGVTALTRATAWRMEQNGMTYPAQGVGDWLREADVTHVSHEVAFDPECGPPNPVQEGLLFCSDPRYIELLEHIGVDVVEMTGNHIADAGVEHVESTLDMYVERGWQYFGGGRNVDDARQPAIFQHNGNSIAFLGCNPVGPPSVWATSERAGAAPCDYDQLYTQITELRAQGVLPIVTLQYWEMDRYDPTPQQVADFQALIDAGAAIVSGSHAHHAQGFGFHGDGFIHFGVGNLFFDQMQMLGYRQEFIDRHVFYNGRHISTELLTALLEDWSRPRPMTEQERAQLLQTVFAVSHWE